MNENLIHITKIFFPINQIESTKQIKYFLELKKAFFDSKKISLNLKKLFSDACRLLHLLIDKLKNKKLYSYNNKDQNETFF